MGYQRLVITPGEPAGIGADLCIKIAQQPHKNELVIIADPDLMYQRAEQLKLPLNLKKFNPEQPVQSTPAATLNILPVQLKTAVTPGKLDSLNAPYVLETLTHAVEGCLNQTFAALITAPVHKGIINQAGINFTGHTEFLEQLTQCAKVVMMLATDGLKVALATTHLPLREVADSINPELIKQVIEILHSDLQKSFAIKSPKIMVVGLNPHAGENGYLGREEIDIIQPVIEQLTAKGFNLQGPLPADTVFTPKYLQQADAFLAMYHDQGLPVLKYKGFGQAANITLGLPIIRTSVDHGTALDLAGTGKANENSLLTALQYASIMSQYRQINS